MDRAADIYQGAGAGADKQQGRKRVVIVGAGFGGLWAAKSLANKKNVDVLLVDRNNYHTFFPLLYQVAAAELEPEDIVYPIRSTLRKYSNVKFIMADIEKIDFANKIVKSSGYAIHYDYLVLATGTVTQFFDTPGAAQHTFQLKNLHQGVELRNHILNCFELASRKISETQKQSLLTFTIVGGGPTGVEFSGALAELIHGPFKKDYPAIDFNYVHIILIEAANSLLLTFPKNLRDYAQNKLSRMGVEIMLQTFVSHVTGQTVHLKDKGVIPTETVVWTAGVCADPITEKWGTPVTRNNLVRVLPTLALEAYPEVFAIGDVSSIDEGRRQLPMTAPVALQQGVLTAKNILASIADKPLQPFTYKDRGAMVTIGRNSAVALIGKKTFTGFIAWILWLVIHLMNLIGFRNRVMVLINWAVDYLFLERAIRLIFPAPKPKRPPDVS
ncbi:MAG: NAD(P)/FAD-dependent oxidoreductase [Nitrospirae bacterium]|nr:NAD(P)/FAD-dependent oxidoreductase [Nitrospirota bacterium]MBF0616250.1 NAD(P)/FAD-dependent oxidoreductase [Nitrospirota bacterium]